MNGSDTGKWLLLVFVLCLAMLLPYLPGRFDASASTLSFVAQVASYVSALFAPIGVAWLIFPRARRLWITLTLGMLTLTGLVVVLAAVAVNQLALGLILGLTMATALRSAHRRLRSGVGEPSSDARWQPAYLVLVPVALIAFRSTAIPRAADWSRDRAIRHNAPLIAEIESFRERRGHYPLSLQSLHRDIPTGVIGLDRFHYQPSGDGYNLYFVRPHVEIDAMEVVVFNPRDEHHFTAHELDLLRYDGEELDLRRGDRRRTALAHPQWISILFD